MRAAALSITLALAAFLAMLAAPAMAQKALVADLDQKQVRITTGFDGAELLLFGALRLQDGDDIAIIVSGPEKSVAIRRKAKVAGIWINTESATLIGVPSFYHIFSTRPVTEIAEARELERARLGYDHIPFILESDSRIEEGTHEEWQEALLRNMEADGLWGEDIGHVRVQENTLFRTNVTLPANVHPGLYEVRILHFRDREVLNEDISTIEVTKTGLSAGIHLVAHNYAPFYGIFAIIFAMVAGWIAAVAFRR